MRTLDTLLAVVLSLALVAAAVVVPVEVVRALTGSGPWLVDGPAAASTLRGTSWDDGVTRAVLGAVAAVGLLLLGLELRRRRPRELPLAGGADGVRAGTDRRSLQRSLRRAAEQVDGVQTALVRAGRRRVRVTAATRLPDPGDLRDRVGAAVVQRLDAVGLAEPLQVRVDVRRDRS